MEAQTFHGGRLGWPTGFSLCWFKIESLSNLNGMLGKENAKNKDQCHPIREFVFMTNGSDVRRITMIHRMDI